MDFALSDEQRMIRDTAERLAADPAAAWDGCLETGLLGLTVPGQLGGFGGGLIEAALVAEAFGRGLVAVPFVSSVAGAALLGDQASLLAGLVDGTCRIAVATAEPGTRYSLQPRAAARRDRAAFRLTGTKVAVPDGADAHLFLVSALLDGQAALFLVSRGTEGLETRDYRSIDARGLSDLTFADLALPGEALLLADAARPLARAIDHASLLLAAEALGAMATATAATAAYLKTRHQFGRPLASFQVLTHRVADMGVKLDNARSMLLRGLALADDPAAVSATMVAVLQAAEFVCGQAIQLHGGIGMTEELAIGHYYKRIRAIGRTYGDIRHHLLRYADLAVANEAA